MATMVATKTKSETKTEAQVITSQSLGKVLKDWDSAEASAKSYFLKAAQLVAKLKLDRKTVKATLQQYRGLDGMSLEVTTSRLMKSSEPKHARHLQEAIDGDISVREFNDIVSDKKPLAEGEIRPVKDPEKKLVKRLEKDALFALIYDKTFEKTIESKKEFGRLAREAYGVAMSKVEDQTEEEAESEYGEEGEGEEEAA